jgi:hypothetical protein
MSVKQHNQDQRKSFRCAVVADRRFCELKIGETVSPAKLVDESAGGFSVLVQFPTAPATDQPIEIHTVGGWYHARIVHVQESKPEDDEASEGTDSGTWFRLGLHRLGEVTMPDRFSLSRLVEKFFPGSGQWRVPSGVPMVLGLLFAVLMIALSFAVIRSPWRPWKEEGVKQWHAPAAPSTPPSTPPSAPPSTPSVDVLQPRSQPASTEGFSLFSGRSQDRKPLHVAGLKPIDSLRKLPGADSLMLPDMVKHLELTADQQQRIRQLIAMTSQAVRNLDLQMSGRQRQEIFSQRTRLLEQARREALQLLNEQQRAEWKKLTRPETDAEPVAAQPATQPASAAK